MTAPTRSELHELVDRLSDDRIAEAIRLLRMVQEGQNAPEIKVIPARSFRPLVGAFSIGGDAVADTDAVYDE